MTTLLFYLVIAAGIGAVVFFVAVVVFGRGEQMAPLDPRTAPSELPESDISGTDVRTIRFSLAVRGYRMSDVDWTLDRLADRIDDLQMQVRRLEAEQQPEPVSAGYHWGLEEPLTAGAFGATPVASPASAGTWTGPTGGLFQPDPDALSPGSGSRPFGAAESDPDRSSAAAADTRPDARGEVNW